MQTTILTAEEIDPLTERVRQAATRTRNALKKLLDHETDGIELLRSMKFAKMAWHPVDERQLNLIEQINQTWTYLASLRALRFLFENHPEAGGFRLNWGTASGTDILSLAPNCVAAEVFAAVHPKNNRKLQKDLQRLVRDCPNAAARYVFFAAPGFGHERQHKLETVTDIQVWALEV